MTYQIGTDSLVRPQFETTGVLNNTVDQEFRRIGDRWPIFAFAHDLGTVGTTKTDPVVYTVGYVRDTLVQLSNVPNVNSARTPYYLTRYGSIPGMVRPLYTSYVTVLIWHSAGYCTPQRLSQYIDAGDQFRQQVDFGRMDHHTTKQGLRGHRRFVRSSAVRKHRVDCGV